MGDRATKKIQGFWLVALIKSIFIIITDVLSYWIKWVFSGGARRQQIKKLHQLLDSANVYSDWKKIATEIDRLNGKERWKEESKSPDYDHILVERRLKQLRQMRESEDIWSIIFTLRAGLSRNYGGIANSALFSHTMVGTKHLIEEYIAELQLCLEAIADYESPELPLKAKLEFFTGLRQVFGRSALLLSGGASLGLYHLGVIKCLFEHNLLPRIFSGSSAGSLMASLVCSKTDEEMPQIFDPKAINLEAIERKGESTLEKRMSRIRDTGYLFDIEVLQGCVRGNIGDMTFQEAFNRTRRVLNITVSSSTIFEMPRLLNYLTAPNVVIWSAASASCAIPGLYKPVPLMAKAKDGSIIPWNPAGSAWVDGSVENDLPISRLSEQFNVNHFIVSQVNPHVVPFMYNNRQVSKGSFIERLGYVLSSEVVHRINQAMDVGVIPGFVQRSFYWMRMIVSQKYQGDITIVPPVSWSDIKNIMTNPDEAEVLRKISVAEKATFQKLSIIEMHCRTEKALDVLLYRLRIRKLERLGKSYRPLDFALSLHVDEDEEETPKKGRRSHSLSSGIGNTLLN